MQINEAESIQSLESSPLTVVNKEIQDSSIMEDITQTTSDEIQKKTLRNQKAMKNNRRY